ncbi:MAG TPA: four helix bundle protein [Verrucomicrobiae bacterium]|nr:four helix bundle protein [Verrucomicrobiae bacterium]
MNAQRSTLNAQRSSNGKSYDLEDRLLEYGADVIRLVERVPRTQAGSHVAGQLLRSATSPLSNHGEAQAAESVDDFIHKLSLCLKELKESRRWLRLVKRVPLLKPETQVDALLDETEQLIRIFSTSIRTAQKRKLDGKRGSTLR